MRRVDVGDLPIWLGTQKSPRLETAPFGFEIGEAGLIRMCNYNVADRMIAAYSSDDYHFITSPPGASEWGNTLVAKSLDGLFATYGSVAGKSILELGGGTLYTAEALVAKHGASHVTVCDPALKARSADPRVDVVTDYFTTATRFDRKFDLIISFNTLEHVPEPLRFLEAISANLDDGMLVYLKLPESGNSIAIGDIGVCVHEHLSYFTPKSLDVCLRRAGLQRRAQSNYLGALQVLAGKADVDKAAADDESERLLGAFDRNSRRQIDALSSRITNAGYKSVAFVGASVGLSNILHLTGLGEKVRLGVFDNDALKHGEFIPGVATPVAAPDALALARYDAIFITPVNFFDEIKAGLDNTLGGTSRPIFPVFEPQALDRAS